MHLAFAPVILKVENWRPRRITAGWMSPLTLLRGFGCPKCENMRRPLVTAASSPPWVDSRVSFPERLADSGGGLSPEVVPLLPRPCAPIAVPPVLSATLPLAPPLSPWAFDAAARAFAARCFSCNSRLCAFVIWLCTGFSAARLPGIAMLCREVLTLAPALDDARRPGSADTGAAMLCC